MWTLIDAYFNPARRDKATPPLAKQRRGLLGTHPRCFRRTRGTGVHLAEHEQSAMPLATVWCVAPVGAHFKRAATRVCRQAGATVAMHVLMCDLNVVQQAAFTVAFVLRGDMPLLTSHMPYAVAWTLGMNTGTAEWTDVSTRRWSAPSSEMDSRAGAQARPALALQQAKARKFRTYPEHQPGGQARCRLVMFGLEVGGRFDRQAVALLRRLARARARDRVPWGWAAAIAALTRRRTALAALAALRADAQSLLELPIRPFDASDGGELPLGEFPAEPP